MLRFLNGLSVVLASVGIFLVVLGVMMIPGVVTAQVGPMIPTCPAALSCSGDDGCAEGVCIAGCCIAGFKRCTENLPDPNDPEEDENKKKKIKCEQKSTGCEPLQGDCSTDHADCRCRATARTACGCFRYVR